MRRSIYISLLYLFVFSSFTQAQDKKYVYRDSSLLQSEENIDSAVVEPPIVEAPVTTIIEEDIDTTLRHNGLEIPPDSAKQWKDLKEFAYIKNLDSLLKAKQEEERKKGKDYSASSESMLDRILSSSFTQVLLWMLAGLFILLIIYRLFLAEGAFKKQSKSIGEEKPDIQEELITPETDFDALINQSLKNNNYRQAVRYQYLKTLHRLAGKELIELAPDKTNYQYVREMKKPLLQNEFASLTLNYEYVWYGEFAIEKEMYNRLEKHFLNFNQKL
jgi:uncharacterized protein DUF4129